MSNKNDEKNIQKSSLIESSVVWSAIALGLSAVIMSSVRWFRQQKSNQNESVVNDSAGKDSIILSKKRNDLNEEAVSEESLQYSDNSTVSYRCANDIEKSHISASRNEPAEGLWTKHAAWYLPSCPREYKPYHLDDVDLAPILQTLSFYQVDPNTGFLPKDDPMHRLQQGCYHIWEDLADDLPRLLGARFGKARESIRSLPVLTDEKLTTLPELRRAHLLLSLFAHAYVWGGDTPMEVLPESVAIPLWNVSQRLGLPAVLTHSDIILYNWRRLDPLGDICMENLATLNNFFDGCDESWFYLITVEIEAKGGRAIVPMLLAIDAIQRYETERSQRMMYQDSFDNELLHEKDDKKAMLLDEEVKELEENEDIGMCLTNTASTSYCEFPLHKPLTGDMTLNQVVPYVTGQLRQICQAIQAMTESLSNMRQGCLPYIFYHRVRPFLAGWKHNVRMPKGLIYSGVSTQGYEFHGGSAAQSALIPFLDITLGISHEGSAQSNVFLLAMREYMLPAHRSFLQHMQQVTNIRHFVLHHTEPILHHYHAQQAQTEEKYPHALFIEHKPYEGFIIKLEALQSTYDDCVQAMIAFRTRHIAIVAEYIIAQQRFDGETVTGKRSAADTAGGRGTGGTELLTFLKPIRDDCIDRLIEEPQVNKVASTVSGDAGNKALVTTTITTTKEVQIYAGMGSKSVDLEGDVTTYSMTSTAVLAGDQAAAGDDPTIVPTLLSSYSMEE